MFIIILIFIFGGSAITISKKNKFSPDEALTIFLCSLLPAITLPTAIEYVSPTIHKPTQPRMPPISIGEGIGEQRGENKHTLFTLN